MIQFIIAPNLVKAQEDLLKERFLFSCQKINVDNEKALQLSNQLFSLYNDPSRHYHNLTHIWNFFQLLDYYKQPLEESILFELAIWYHDAIYDASKKDNELQSALLFQKLFEKELTTTQVNYVVNVINSTAKHFPIEQHSDIFYFLDLDLAVLGTDEPTYHLYQEAIWQEYKSAYPKLLYKIGRKKVLKAFLEREKIYFSPIFMDNYESTARQNIELELNS